MRIQSRPATEAYRRGWERIFGCKKKKKLDYRRYKDKEQKNRKLEKT